MIGTLAWNVAPAEAAAHVLGYTIVNDVSSRDPWLDGDQWLLGKSMPGFCPVGPVVVTPDELDPSDLRLGCTINGEPIQDGRTSSMRVPGRRDRLVPQPPPHPPPRRPDRDRHAGPPRVAARPRSAPPAGRHRHRVDRGDRRAHHPHRLTRTRGETDAQAADRVHGPHDRPRGAGVPARAPDGHRAHRVHRAARAARAAADRRPRPDRGRASRRGGRRRARRPADQLRAVLPARGVHRRRPHPDPDLHGAHRGPVRGPCRDRLPPDRVPQRPLRQHLRDRLRLRRGRAQAARGRPRLPGQLLGRDHRRGGRRVLRPDRRPARQPGRDVRGDGDRPRAGRPRRRQRRDAAVPRRRQRRRRPHRVLLLGARVRPRGERVGHVGRRARVERRVRRALPRGRHRARRGGCSTTSSARSRRCPAAEAALESRPGRRATAALAPRLSPRTSPACRPPRRPR